MKILALDTSTIMTTIAVLDEEKLLGEYSLNQDMSHSEKLIPMIRQLLLSLDIRIEEIDLFAVALGPGSFTGVRIGVTTVKTLAHLFDKPLVGVSSLEALAFNLAPAGIVVPMMDARRNRVYRGVYSWQGQELVKLREEDVIEVDQLLEELDGSYDKLSVNGDGASLYREQIKLSLKEKVSFAPLSHNSSRASSVGEVALIKYRQGHVDNYFTLVPEYLRETQAQRQLEKKEKD